MLLCKDYGMLLYVVVVVVHDTQNNCIFQKAMTQKSAKGSAGEKVCIQRICQESFYLGSLAYWHLHFEPRMLFNEQVGSGIGFSWFFLWLGCRRGHMQPLDTFCLSLCVLPFTQEAVTFQSKSLQEAYAFHKWTMELHRDPLL